MLKECYLVLPDVHGCASQDKYALEIALHSAGLLTRAYPITRVIQLGDLCDGAELSAHPATHIEEAVPPWSEELEWAQDMFWERLKDEVPGAQLHFIEGNHEFRAHKKLLTQFGRGKLSTEMYQSLNACNKFESCGVHVTRYGADTVQESILELNDIVFCHGWSHAIHAAKNHLDKTLSSRCLVFGHTHRIAQYTRRDPLTGKQVWSWSFGTLSATQHYYNRATPTDHAHGFGMVLISEDGTASAIQISIHSYQGSYQCILPTGDVVKAGK